MTEAEIKELIAIKSESARLDYKESLDWSTASKEDKGKIVKDILAFSNYSGGGRIIFGVRDNDFELVGLSDDAYNSFDITEVNNFLKQYSDPKIEIFLQKAIINNMKVVVIEINEFISAPFICKKDLQTNDGKNILQNGMIYIRNDAAQSVVVENHETMRELLNRALRSRSNELLKEINIIISGKSGNEAQGYSDIFAPSIEEAMQQIDVNLAGATDKLLAGNITLLIKPSMDLSAKNETSFLMQDKIRAAQVTNRGWNFPHINTGNSGRTFNTGSGITSVTIWTRFNESFYANKNGLFVWRSTIWEDHTDDHRLSGKKVMSFINLIYSTLEYVLFTNKYYDYDDYKPGIEMSLVIDNCEQRRLIALDSSIMLFEDYVCHIAKIEIPKIRFALEESIADPKSISKKMAKAIFECFNFKLEDRILEGWQDKYLKKEF